MPGRINVRLVFYIAFFLFIIITLHYVGPFLFGRTKRNTSPQFQDGKTDPRTTSYSSSRGSPAKVFPPSPSPRNTAAPAEVPIQRRHVILVVNIITAPSRYDRREALRATWLKQCRGSEVVCNFFTDPLSELDPKERNATINETRTHGDLKFMSVPRGYNFGRRILWLLEWSTQNYDFDFFLRVDDDYFVCLKKLLMELPHRQKTARINWGYLHCVEQYKTRIDEGFMIFSAALAQEFLRQKDNLLCGPYGGLTVAVWVTSVKNVTFFHDPRIYYQLSSAKFKSAAEICKTWLALHGSYPDTMRSHWSIASKENVNKYEIPPIVPVKKVCRYEVHYDWRKSKNTEPLLCRLNPVFKGAKMHSGSFGK